MGGVSWATGVTNARGSADLTGRALWVLMDSAGMSSAKALRAGGSSLAPVVLQTGRSCAWRRSRTDDAGVSGAVKARLGYHDPHAKPGGGSVGGMRNAGGADRSRAASGAVAAASRRVSAGRRSEEHTSE